jgi:hypothetical protein
VDGAQTDWYLDACGGTYVDTADVLIVYLTETRTYYARARDPAGCESEGCMAATVTVWTRGSGDVNGDGLLNGEDIEHFIGQMLTPDAASGEYCAADMNGDSSVTPLDTPLFVAALLSAG